jgi:N-acetylglucosamine kinase-like BadF-type ATPase
MALVAAQAERRRYGIDAGGSGTSVLAWNGDRWTVPPLNPSSVGHELSQRRLAELFAQLHVHADCSDGPGCRAADAPAIWLAWAAIDRAAAGTAARRCALAAREVGLRAQFVLSNDLVPLLIRAPAGTGHIIAVCGTGSGFLATNGRSGAVRVGGCEYLGSDEGSAFDLGLRGLRAAVRGLDGRGASTALSDLLAVQAGEPVADFARSLAQLPFPKSAVAALAPAVLQAWLDGDLVADALVGEAVGELMLGVRAAHDAAEVLPGWRLSVLGGVVTGCPDFFTRLAVAAASLGADRVELISDPVAEVLAALTQVSGSGFGRRPDRRVDRDVWDLSTTGSCAERVD